MTDREVGMALWGIARRNPCVNWQENQMLREAAKRLMERPDDTPRRTFYACGTERRERERRQKDAEEEGG